MHMVPEYLDTWGIELAFFWGPRVGPAGMQPCKHKLTGVIVSGLPEQLKLRWVESQGLLFRDNETELHALPIPLSSVMEQLHNDPQILSVMSATSHLSVPALALLATSLELSPDPVCFLHLIRAHCFQHRASLQSCPWLRSISMSPSRSPKVGPSTYRKPSASLFNAYTSGALKQQSQSSSSCGF